MQRTLLTVVAALAAIGQSASAQSTPAPLPDYMAPPFLLPAATVITVIRAGRLVDVDKGTVLRDQVIVVRGSMVASIEPAPGHVPAGARVIDLSKYTVTPGLIDCHTHLIGGDESANASAPLERSAGQEELAGVKNARRTLLAGFTTVRDVGTYRAFLDVALRDYINDGYVMGPHMAVAGAYITVSSGGGEVTGLATDVGLPPDMRFGVANNADEVRQKVREILNRGADLIKVIATGGTYLDADIYNGDYTNTVGREQGWSTEILRKNDETTDAQRQGFKKAVAAGVKMTFGTDAGVYPHGLNARQLPYMVKWGMTPMQALQSATINAATLIGWQDKIGSIAPGKSADIIAVEGDALADLSLYTNVAFVMKSGTIYRAPSTGAASR